MRIFFEKVTPIVFPKIHKPRTLVMTSNIVKCLIDSGATGTIIDKTIAKGLPTVLVPRTQWTTAAGQINTSKQVKVNFSLPEFDEDKTIAWQCHVTDMSKLNYDMIIGTDLLKELGMIIDYKLKVVHWDQVAIPMKNRETTVQEACPMLADLEAGPVQQATQRMKNILDAKYERMTPQQIASLSTHLSTSEQQKLQAILSKFEHLFDGSLGTWKMEDYSIELKEGVKPYHGRPYSIPKIYEQTLKEEIEHLVKAGVLRKVNHSEWGAPTFIIPKKDKTVRFITDFRELNKRIRRKPFPLPKIQELLLKLEGFQYATSLDLNMGYYHITLDADSRKLCTLVLPWGKYEYLHLPMGLCNSPDIFQEKMSDLMAGLEFVRVYLDDILAITKGTFDDHLEKLEQLLNRVSAAGLKVNGKKSFFARSELEYLGYFITKEGIRPVEKKVEAIMNLAPPTTKKQLRRFIGLVNFYRDMWQHRSTLLAPLTKLTSKSVPWKWTDVE